VTLLTAVADYRSTGHTAVPHSDGHIRPLVRENAARQLSLQQTIWLYHTVWTHPSSRQRECCKTIMSPTDRTAVPHIDGHIRPLVRENAARQLCLQQTIWLYPTVMDTSVLSSERMLQDNYVSNRRT
jgi:hypothetical protein